MGSGGGVVGSKRSCGRAQAGLSDQAVNFCRRCLGDFSERLTIGFGRKTVKQDPLLPGSVRCGQHSISMA